MKWLFRILFYALGLLLMAFGVAFSVNSGLGVSPVNSLPFAVSAVSGFPLGTCVIAVFSGYILVQVLLLRRRFKPINLLQILFSTLFGYFVDFAKWALGSFAVPTYAGQLLMLAISLVLVALGLVFYLGAELVPMPMEGMTLAIASKLPKIPFHIVKIIVDCLSVLVAVLVGLIGSGAVAGVREGTVVSALVIAKLMQWFSKPIRPRIRAVCFSDAALANS